VAATILPSVEGSKEVLKLEESLRRAPSVYVASLAPCKVDRDL
jgi:hypothetical protein